MKSNILIFSIYEGSISIIFSLIVLFCSLKFIEKFIIKSSLAKIVEHKNTAMAIFSGGILYCFMSLSMVSILPSVNYLQAKLYEIPNLELSFYFFAFLVFLAGMLFSFLLAASIMFLTTRIFYITTTQIDEAKEILENNISISIVLTFSMIAVTHYIKPSLSNFIKAAVHYLS